MEGRADETDSRGSASIGQSIEMTRQSLLTSQSSSRDDTLRYGTLKIRSDYFYGAVNDADLAIFTASGI